MAKKTRSLQWDYDLRLAAYKWEFIRRNPDYIQDYNKYELASSEQVKRHLFKAFSIKYHLGYPMSPSYSMLQEYKEINSEKYKSINKKLSIELGKTKKGSLKEKEVFNQLGRRSIVPFYSFLSKQGNIQRWSGGYVRLDGEIQNNKNVRRTAEEIWEGFGKNLKPTDKRSMLVLIDVTSSKQKIFRNLSREIDSIQNVRIKDTPRRRFPELKRYLETYDLIDGYKRNLFKKAARELNSSYHQVYRDYHECKKIINGGFLHLR